MTDSTHSSAQRFQSTPIPPEPAEHPGPDLKSSVPHKYYWPNPVEGSHAVDESERNKIERDFERRRKLFRALQTIGVDWRSSVLDALKDQPAQEGIGTELAKSQIRMNGISKSAALELAKATYQEFNHTLQTRVPENVWLLGIDFFEHLFEEQPDRPISCAEQFFLKKAIVEENLLSNRVYSLEQMTTEVMVKSDKQAKEDPLKMEEFIAKQMQKANDIDGVLEIPVEDLLEHVRTVTYGKPLAEIKERFYWPRFVDEEIVVQE